MYVYINISCNNYSRYVYANTNTAWHIARTHTCRVQSSLLVFIPAPVHTHSLLWEFQQLILFIERIKANTSLHFI